MKIYVIRHGQTDWNVAGKCQGRTDIELNETGIEQAKQAKEQLKNYNIDQIICSPLKRTRKIDIYVPDDYQTSKKRYPVLIINDGQNAFFDEEAYIGKSWGFLESIKEMKSMIIFDANPINNKMIID